MLTSNNTNKETKKTDATSAPEYLQTKGSSKKKTTKLAEERKKRKKEDVEIRRLRRLLKKRRMYEIQYGTVTYHGLLMLFWSTLREVGRYPV